MAKYCKRVPRQMCYIFFFFSFYNTIFNIIIDAIRKSQIFFFGKQKQGLARLHQSLSSALRLKPMGQPMQMSTNELLLVMRLEHRWVRRSIQTLPAKPSPVTELCLDQGGNAPLAQQEKRTLVLYINLILAHEGKDGKKIV